MTIGLKDVAMLYSSAATKNPLLVNGGCGAAFAALGDSLCQSYFEKLPVHNWKRTINIAIIRAFFAVPWLMYWYPKLQILSPGQDHLSILKRVLLDLAIGTPMMIAIVFLGSAFLTGTLFSNPHESFKLFQQQFWSTYKKGMQFWPPLHFTVTYRIPAVYRPLISHVGSCYFNAVLSWSATRKLKND
jgi:Mpv17-like protein